jgi:hypothetical protein
LLQGCHSILGLGWPKPGVPQIGGGRVFIGTNPFLALKDEIRQTNIEFESLYKLQSMQTTWEAWHLVTGIVSQFEVLGRQSLSSAIDPAFNLIYLTTGVLYHHISIMFSIVPKPVQPFATVETLEKLLSDCSWKQTENNLDTESILKTLIERLRASQAELKKGIHFP